MYTSTFIFAKGNFDDAFHRLDQEIAEMAKAIPGYLGEETWESAATGLVSNVYYWDSLEALQKLMAHPKHLEAKARQGDWLAGYQVVIAEVLRMYGDGKLGRELPAATMALALNRQDDVRNGRTEMVPGDEAAARVRARLK